MSETMLPGPLADSDIYILREFLIQIAVQLLLQGIYSALVIIVLYNLWTNKAKSAARCILIAASISMFVACTTQLFVSLAYYLIQLPTAGFDPPNVERSLINMDIFGDAMVRLNSPRFTAIFSKGKVKRRLFGD
ncbi:hypothetical protein C8J56DRAFT_1046743 [Mycena floridula]|nr:hypothetical protein C8J56DRAFT_1046743 [Mycena floridula]